MGFVSYLEECDKVTVELFGKKMVHGKLNATIHSEIEEGREGGRDRTMAFHLLSFFFDLSCRPLNPATKATDRLALCHPG